MTPFTPPVLDIAPRMAAVQALARGGFWAAVTVYVELVSLLVQWELQSPPHGERWTRTLIGLALAAIQTVLLRRPGRLVLHAGRAGVFLCLAGLFCANLVAWNGGPSSDRGIGMLVVLLPWPLLLAQALFAARHARADAARFVDRPMTAARAWTGAGRWSWLKGPRAGRAAPWFVAAFALAATGVTLAVLRDHGALATPLARFPQLWAAAAALVAYRGLRHLQPRAAEVRAADTRAPVLILRAFNDDRLAMQAVALGPRTTFEQVIAGALRGRGPVITVGDPKEPLPRLGAAREYLNDADWRRAVDSLIGEATQLVFMLADTENLAWEFRRAVARQRLADTLLLVPPVNGRDAARRWAGLMHRELDWPHATALAGTPPPAGLVAVAFPAGQPVFVVSRRRRPVDYAVAIDVAAALQVASQGGADAAVERVVSETALLRRV